MINLLNLFCKCKLDHLITKEKVLYKNETVLLTKNMTIFAPKILEWSYKENLWIRAHFFRKLHHFKSLNISSIYLKTI
jgi:hypothetical protein